MLRLLSALIILLCGMHRPACAHMVVVSVGNGGNFFNPSNFTIAPGDTVRWVWIAGHHNTSAYSTPAGATAWYSDMDHMTSTFDFIASISGLYKYTCTYHSGMDGQFFVTGCSYPSTPNITSATATSCLGDTTILYTQLQPGATLQWLNGLSLIPGATTDTLKVTTPGNYKVVANRCGVDSVSTIFPASFHTRPAPSYTHTKVGNTYTFTNTTVPLSNSAYIWKFDDGSPDQYTTDAIHSFATTGTYNVTLKATNLSTGCSDSVSTPIAYLSVNETTNSDQYRIYPNPARSTIHIESTEQLSFTITDLTGRRLQTQICRIAGSYHINLTNFTIGVYILHISNDKASFHKKIIVEGVN